jgi:protein-arginine kinase activator protein McsA
MMPKDTARVRMAGCAHCYTLENPSVVSALVSILVRSYPLKWGHIFFNNSKVGEFKMDLTHL